MDRPADLCRGATTWEASEVQDFGSRIWQRPGHAAQTQAPTSALGSCTSPVSAPAELPSTTSGRPSPDGRTTPATPCWTSAGYCLSVQCNLVAGHVSFLLSLSCSRVVPGRCTITKSLSHHPRRSTAGGNTAQVWDTNSTREADVGWRCAQVT